MADTFQGGSTIICSIEVRKNGVLYNPATSTTITIKDCLDIVVVNNATMTPDTTGKFHYDFVTTTSFRNGIYRVLPKGIDGARTAIGKKTFILEA